MEFGDASRRLAVIAVLVFVEVYKPDIGVAAGIV